MKQAIQIGHNVTDIMDLDCVKKCEKTLSGNLRYKGTFRSRKGLAGVLRGRELGFNEPIRVLPYKEQAMTKEQIIHCVSVLKEVQKDFRFNTNIDTAIREYESRLKELEK